MEGIYFQNIPLHSTVEHLRCKLSERLIEDCGDIKIQIFTNEDNRSRVAVASGFKGNVSEILPKLQNIRIGCNFLRAKYDRGDERNEFGVLKHPRPPGEIRMFKQLKKISSRKVTVILDDSFSATLRGVYAFQSPVIFCYLNGRNPNEISAAGDIVTSYKSRRYEEKHGSDFYLIEFQTIVEAIQAISLFNNACGSKGNVIFSNSKGSAVATTERLCGLGRDGEVINIRDIVAKNGLIPFENFDASILNNHKIKQLRSTCWKCKSANRDSNYRIIGTSANLDYLGGRCSCNYVANLPVLHTDRPFKHAQECFTRLFFDRTLVGSSCDLTVMHEPMKLNYTGADNYREITAPILFDEWKTYSSTFKELHTTNDGSIAVYEFLEVIEKDHEDVNLFYAELLVPRSDFWDKDCVLKIRGLTIYMNVLSRNNTRIQKEVRRVRVIRAVPAFNQQTKLFCRFELQKGNNPIIQKNVKVVPKPSKLEYSNTIHVLGRMASGKFHSEILQSILKPGQTMDYPVTGIAPRKIPFVQTRLMRLYRKKLETSLNAEQLAALKSAKVSSLSIVQGPPGTGKTYLAAVTSIILSMKEEGCILAAASSNFAADGLAIALISVLQKFNIPLKIIRMYALSKENQYLRENETPLRSFGVSCLHEEVTHHANWLQGEEFDAIREDVRQYHLERLTSKQLLMLEGHKRQLERQILDSSRIIVSTIGSLSDRRVMGWSNAEKIPTVIVDEAGQTRQPDMPFMFMFKQKRTVVYGDHLQLKPHVESLGASLAGLQISYMEWIDLGGAKVPWTVLKEQHRMNPGIRSLVSAVTYSNELRDAPIILTRKDEIPSGVYLQFPEMKLHDILLYNHKFPESKGSGTSYFNEGEALGVINVVDTLLFSGLHPSCITILTFYEAQKVFIQRKLSNHGVTVSNVDSYQGRENILTIVCLTRSNAEGDIGFVKVMNRVNVAISRAKFKLIIFCNLDSFTADNYSGWKKMAVELQKTASITKVPNKI